MLNSKIALTVSSAEDDVPLSLANRGFCNLTGYDREEVEGRNCRLLQGLETSAESQAALHDFVHDPARDDGRFAILNYRKDGSTFHNLVFMTRLRSRDGAARFILASQFDMTTAEQRKALRSNDERLSRNLADLQVMGQQFGLAMEDSARAIFNSIAMLARLNLDE
ncbi:PAS domain-containing protein [Palleronia sp.]|uniref:PAS domain-containing protein n=1 Tax=Palleronia sp. TaxID=1940284 RepID=UPI0035C7CED5